MTQQSWVMQKPARAAQVSDESNDYASDNRRKILGSTIFGGNTSPPPMKSPQLTQSFPQQASSPTQIQSEPASFQLQTDDLYMQSADLDITFKGHKESRLPEGKRLDVQANPQMRQLREELNREAASYVARARKIGL